MRLKHIVARMAHGPKRQYLKIALRTQVNRRPHLVTRFKMGLITAGGLGEVAKGMPGSERASAAKRVLAAIEDSA